MRLIATDAELAAAISGAAGLIYNDFSGPAGGHGNVLHAAACRHLRAANIAVRKVMFDTLDEATAWLASNRGDEGTSWRRCGACLPAPASLVAGAVAKSQPVPRPPADRHTLLKAVQSYRQARALFLQALGVPISNRDPLAEFAEGFVHALVGGTLATSRVQKGYDLVDPSSARVQVRYVANPPGEWVNGHTVAFDPDVDAYALMLIEGLEPRAVLWFERDTLRAVCAALGKRHPDQDRLLQLTPSNVNRLITDRATFRALGVRVWEAAGWDER